MSRIKSLAEKKRFETGWKLCLINQVLILMCRSDDKQLLAAQIKKIMIICFWRSSIEKAEYFFSFFFFAQSNCWESCQTVTQGSVCLRMRLTERNKMKQHSLPVTPLRGQRSFLLVHHCSDTNCSFFQIIILATAQGQPFCFLFRFSSS